MRSILIMLLIGTATAARAADVTFTDVSSAAGVNRSTESYGASVADVNGDGYPDIWVSNHRTRPALYVNQRNGAFTDIAPEVMVWLNEPGRDTHGGSFADIDNDGDQDLLVTLGRNNDQQLLINDDGVLLNRAREYGIATSWIGGRLPVWYDYNNDAFLDVSVAQFAGVSRMYTNQYGLFTDDTADLEAVCTRHHYSQLIDTNRDGALNLVCAKENEYPQAIFDMTTLPWRWITWQFDPRVQNVADSILGDFNNDQRMDIFLLSGVQTRPSGGSLHGDRRVEFRTQGGEKAIHFVSDGAVTMDLDWNLFKRNDGLTRILIGADGEHPSGVPLTITREQAAGMPPRAPSDMTPAILIGFDEASNRWSFLTQTDNKWSDAYFELDTEVAVSNLNLTGLWGADQPNRPTLLTADEEGWSDGTVAAGLTDEVLCASVTTGDFNNDMHLDLYLACRDGAENLPNRLYYGSADGTFRRAATAGGAEGPVGTAIASGAGTADSVVSADFDLDGFLDLFITNGFNMRPKFVGGPGVMFRNNGNDNNWVMLDLAGTTSNPDAVGARITATAGGVTQLRVQNGGYHRWTQEHKRVHFGMAQEDRVDLTIEWPSGIQDVHQAVAVNHLYTATEGGDLVAFQPDSSAPPCGTPDYDPEAEAAVYVWQFCSGERFGVRVTAGGGGHTHTGILVSDIPYDRVEPVSIESSDTFNASDPNRVDVTLNVWGRWEDGVNLWVAPSPGKCFTFGGDGGAPVYFGPERVQVPNSFNPQTFEACQ